MKNNSHHTLRQTAKFIILQLLLLSAPCAGEVLTFLSDNMINMSSVNDGDTICLQGMLTTTLVVSKNIVIDGDCDNDGVYAVINGATKIDWVKSGGGWITKQQVEPVLGRLPGWVAINGKLLTLSAAGIKRKGNHYYTDNKQEETSIPIYYAGVELRRTKGAVIKNLIIKNYITHGIVASNTVDTVIDNVHVSYVGGGVSVKNFPAAGAGITFDGNTNNVIVKNSVVSECYDTGLSIQLFKNYAEQANKIRFIDNKVDRCGAGLSVAIHKPNGSIINDVEIVGKFTNLGYGWSGIYDNNVHGRGVMLKQGNESKITNVVLHDSIIDTYAWVGVLQYGGELDARGNTIKNGTGEYKSSKNIRPSAYTASGLDYSTKPDKNEAIGKFSGNVIDGVKGYAYQIINNRPLKSSRQLTISNNIIKGNDEYMRSFQSDDILQ